MKEKNIVFSIKDFAGGIKGKIKGKIFKEMVTTKGKNGTGLGLYISYAIITGKFYGNIWFDSRLNEGTIFYISIPSFIKGKTNEEENEYDVPLNYCFEEIK